MRTISSTSAVVTSVSSANVSEKAPTLCEDDAAILMVAIQDMHSVVRTMGELLPSWEKCGEKDREAVVVRSLRLLSERAKFLREEKFRAVRAAIKGVIETHMNIARNEKAEFDAISPALRAKLGIESFPETVKIPVADLMCCFPAGLTEEQVIHNLDNMSFKLGKGKERGSRAYVAVPFTAK